MSRKNSNQVAIMVALGLEASIVKKAIRAHATKGPQVYVVGMGAKLARRKIAQVKQNGATAIVSLGFCGALDPALVSGQVIIPKTALYDGDKFVVNEIWQSQLVKTIGDSIDVFENRLVTTPVVIATVEEKTRLRENTGACAVDMESAVLATEAEKQNMSFVAVRVVLDTAAMEIPRAFIDIINEKGKINVWKLLKNLVFHWPGLKTIKAQTNASRDAGDNLSALTRLVLPDFKLPK